MSVDLDSLLPVIYEDLIRLARFQRSRVYSKKNLGTKSIVHEAYLNISKSHAAIKNKDQLLYLTSIAMRNILIDNARVWNAKKRGSGKSDLSLDHVNLISAQKSQEILALEEALIKLNNDNPRMVDIVTCIFFGGLNQRETSIALGISVSTVKRDWTLAKALLFQSITA